jgi:hypothetical protein
MGMGAVFSQIVGELADGTAVPLAWTVLIGVILAVFFGQIPVRRRARRRLTASG